MFLWNLRSYPVFMMSWSSRISLKSAALPSHAALPTATVTLLIPLKMPSPSVRTAHLPAVFAVVSISAGQHVLNSSLFSSFTTGTAASPRSLRNEPNSYLSNRSATALSYVHVTAMASVSMSRAMSVLMVTSSWLRFMWPAELSKASRCFGVSSSRCL